MKTTKKYLVYHCIFAVHLLEQIQEVGEEAEQSMKHTCYYPMKIQSWFLPEGEEESHYHLTRYFCSYFLFRKMKRGSFARFEVPVDSLGCYYCERKTDNKAWGQFGSDFLLTLLFWDWCVSGIPKHRDTKF